MSVDLYHMFWNSDHIKAHLTGHNAFHDSQRFSTEMHHQCIHWLEYEL